MSAYTHEANFEILIWSCITLHRWWENSCRVSSLRELESRTKSCSSDNMLSFLIWRRLFEPPHLRSHSLLCSYLKGSGSSVRTCRPSDPKRWIGDRGPSFLRIETLEVYHTKRNRIKHHNLVLFIIGPRQRSSQSRNSNLPWTYRSVIYKHIYTPHKQTGLLDFQVGFMENVWSSREWSHSMRVVHLK